jgi:hypothetical protein
MTKEAQPSYKICSKLIMNSSNLMLVHWQSIKIIIARFFKQNQFSRAQPNGQHIGGDIA